MGVETSVEADRRFVGIDLAWGSKAATGLAVLDERGRLLNVATVHTDDEIVGWMHSGAPGSCLVAIDAPIIVPNLTGRRQCETLVSRHFGRYNAGAHSSNRSLPAFQDGPRALRLSEALGLEVAPSSTSPRRAIEVYPHPAIVMLFGLTATLQYKAKSGRPLETRQAELLRLVGHLDSLAAADPPLMTTGAPAWTRIREEIEGASRPVQLERVEDAVDAVVCAYIALYAEAKPESVRILGDEQGGYILTPVTEQMGRQLDADEKPTSLSRRPARQPHRDDLPQQARADYVVVLVEFGVPRRVSGPFADQEEARMWAIAHSGPEREAVVLPLEA